MDALSNLFGWLTGNWVNQSMFGKTCLGCAILLIMACICGFPLFLLTWFEF